MDHFTVVCCVAWPLNGCEAEGDLVVIAHIAVISGLTCKRSERVNSVFYYMASSASGQDEPNRAL